MINFSVVDQSSDVNEMEEFSQDLASVDIPYSIFAQPDVIRVLRCQPDNAWFLLETVSLDEWLRAIANCTKNWVDIFGNQEGASYARVYIRDRLEAVCENFPALRYTMGWLQYVTIGDMPSAVIEIAKYQNLGAQVLLEKMWHGSNSLIQSQLLRQHPVDVIWPSSPFFVRAWTVFFQCLSPDAMQVLTDTVTWANGLFWGEADDHRFMVANLPVLLGLWSMTGTPMTWWHRQRRITLVEQIRAFDLQWFDIAYRHGVMLAVILRVQYKPVKDGGVS